MHAHTCEYSHLIITPRCRKNVAPLNIRQARVYLVQPAVTHVCTQALVHEHGSQLVGLESIVLVFSFIRNIVRRFEFYFSQIRLTIKVPINGFIPRTRVSRINHVNVNHEYTFHQILFIIFSRNTVGSNVWAAMFSPHHPYI